jgi:L-2,4-diaminobutyric acid acetyltransferase
MPTDSDTPRTRRPRLRKPNATDGADIWTLVKTCTPLDENSMYCNLIQADHFCDTCVVADLDGQIVGWTSGHKIPNTQELFVWQVAVHPKARGMGLGRRMLSELIGRDACRDATHLKTTITKDNDASWALFSAFARAIGGDQNEAPHFERHTHFNDHHDTEHMVTITLPAPDARAQAA